MDQRLTALSGLQRSLTRDRERHHAFSLLRTAAVGLLVVGIVASAGAGAASLAQPLPQGHPTPIDTPRLAGPSDPDELETFIDGVMDAHLQAHNVPGAVVTVVVDGERFFTKGYGYGDLEGRTSVDAERTLFRPGSISKLFTWTAVMQLVEKGTLSPNVDVNEYLDFAIPDTFPEPITLEHLMTHTPGFEDVGAGLFFLDEEKLISLEDYVKGYCPARVFPPGEVAAYSNYATALAGYIVQRVSGTPFEAYVEERIFAPLGMERSTFRQPLPAELAEDMAHGYGFSQGAFVAGEFELISGSPAGALSAAGADLAPFMIAHLKGGAFGSRRILEATTIEQMHASQYLPDPRTYGFGYGFFRNRMNDRLIVSHEGDTMLFHSGCYLLPEEGDGLFVSYNSAGGCQARVELLESFLDRYYPAPPPEPVTPPADFSSRLDAYTGQYHPARHNFTTAEKILLLFQPVTISEGPEGNLTVNLFGTPDQYVEVEPGLLREVQGEDRVVVDFDDQGRVTRAIPASVIPYTLFRAPWYATMTFALVLLISGLVLYLFTLAGWAVAFFTTRAHDKDALPPLLARVARWTAAAFVLVSLAFAIGLMAIMGNVNPAYGVPDVFFGEAEGLGTVTALTYAVAALGAGMVGMSVLAWVRRYWGWFGRIWYTLLALVATGWVWLLADWNLLGPGF